jgi:hypothetical protein
MAEVIEFPSKPFERRVVRVVREKFHVTTIELECGHTLDVICYRPGATMQCPSVFTKIRNKSVRHLATDITCNDCCQLCAALEGSSGARASGEIDGAGRSLALS